MSRIAKRLLVCFVAISLASLGIFQTAQAAMIGTEHIAAAVQSGDASRAHIAATLQRPEIQSKLQSLGIDPATAQSRVAALTDEEAASLAGKIDSLPAGGDGILGALVFIFIVLLVTDILGLTKVFPFTRSVRR